MTSGKRVRPGKVPPQPRGKAQARSRVQGKRQQPPSGRGLRFMFQLVASAVILVTVVVVKFTMPDVAQRYGGDLLHLMGADSDFAAAFSAVGRAVGGDDMAEAFSEAYTAVFGPEKAGISHEVDRNAVVYGAETTPEIVDMLQQVLGFAYQKPVNGTISSAFGFRDHPVEGQERFHYGIDVACEKGEIIRAFADGTVTAVAESTELGKYVELTHADGYTTLYAHCSRINASAGQTVKMGDPIAEAGDTGDATGYHLHFELHHNNIYLNPVYYVSK